MKKNGLTLVEMIAVIVVLALLLVIIVPNITKNIKKSRITLTKVQLNAIKEAASNWAMDNVDKIPSSDDSRSLKLSLTDLSDYLSDDIINPDNDIKDDEIIIFIREVEINNIKKYEYGAYLSYDDYIKEKAIEYVQDNDNQDMSLYLEDLQDSHYIDNGFIDLQGNETIFDDVYIDVTVTEENGKYSYSAEIDE